MSPRRNCIFFIFIFLLRQQIYQEIYNIIHKPWYLAINRPLGYERVYLPFSKVAGTPFQIQGEEIISCIYHVLT